MDKLMMVVHKRIGRGFAKSLGVAYMAGIRITGRYR